MKRVPAKLIDIDFRRCEHGHRHIDNVHSRDAEIYLPEEGEASGGFVGGGSRLYDEGWERMFGQRDVKPENLN